MWSIILSRAVPLQNGVRYCSGTPMKLLRNYEKFQKDNGVPVYIKGGPMDRVLMGLTVGLIFLGIGDGGWTLFKMAKPKKK